MPLQKLPTSGLDDINHRRRARETLNNILNHTFDDSKVRTPAEVAADVTPVNFAYDPGEPERYGAAADGTTDDTAAIRRACLVADRDYGEVKFTRGKRYRFEHTAPDPNTGSGSTVGYAFSGRTGIKIIADGATFVTTNANNAVHGLFTFYNSNYCRVEGGHYEGSFTYDSAWTGAYACIMGDSTGCYVEGSVNGGYALCSVFNRTLAETGTNTDEPKLTEVRGRCNNTRRSVVYVGVGRGHVQDVICNNVSRPVFAEGISGLKARVVGRQTDTAMTAEKMIFGLGTNQDIEIEVDAQWYGDAFALQGTSVAATYKNITVRGRIACTTTSTAVLKLASLGHTGTVIENLDWGGLSIEMATNRAVYIVPDVACTIRNIILPKKIVSTSTGNVVIVDNTAGATMSQISVPQGFRWRSTQSVANAMWLLSGGTVSNVFIGDGFFDYGGTTGSPVQITTADGLVVGKVRIGNSKGFFCVGSVNVAPYILDQLGRGFVHAGALADTTDYSGLEMILVTSGSATINSLSRIVPGQRITFAFNGGTPTFADGTNMKLAGSANFVATAEDTLTLVCIDPPGGGPLATSTMYEVSRSVN